MAIPVIIVTGFLGCGKTSFLRHLLPLCGTVGVRPLLIINEVGDVDVDGELLADLHAEQTRLVGGCVCCTLQSQLTETLYNAMDRDAGDLVIIECSGLSNPLDVLNALSAPALLRRIAVSHVICLLDTSRARAVLQVVELAKHQIATADILLLNKIDKLTEDHRPEVDALLDGLNTTAERHWATYGDIGEEALHRLLTDPAPVREACGCGHEHCHQHSHHAVLPASFCTVALSLPEFVTRPALEAVLAALPEGVIRAKGFAQVPDEGWQVLHRVFDSVDITPMPGPGPSIGPVLICIGRQLDPDALTALVDQVCLQSVG